MDINDLGKVGTAIIILALIVAACTIVLGKFGEYDQITYTVTNETFNCSLTEGFGTAKITSNGAVKLTAAKATNLKGIVVNGVTDGGSLETIVVYNQTRQGVDGAHRYNESGNFTIDTDAGTITCTAGGLLATYGNYSATYKYQTGSAAMGAAEKGVTAETEFSSWLGLIAIVVIAGFIVATVAKLREQ